MEPFEGGMFALRRFLHAYGPSTQPEFSRWFALEPAITRRLFEALREELTEVEVEGSHRWALATDDSPLPEAASAAVHLLPHFDVYVVGFHPRSELMPSDSPVAAISPGTAAPFSVLLVGGRVAGVWERRAKGKRMSIRVNAFQALNRRQRTAVESQAHRIAQILERDYELEFGEVALRPHA